MTNKINLNPIVIFPINIAVLLSLVYTADTFILNADFYQRTLENSGLNWETLLLNTSPKFKLLLYTSSVLLLLLKYSLIALLIYTTFYLNEIKVSYQSIFKIVCQAELVFLIPAAVKVVWFIIYPPTGLEHWAAFYPLSLHSLFSMNSVPVAITYPLQLLNAFELIYILTLSYLLHKLLRNEFDDMLRFVLISYLPGLFLWALITSYFTVMLK